MDKIASNTRKASLFIIQLFCLSIYAGYGFALEIGELKLQSRLGQPLSAQLNIKHQEQLNEQELIIEQAPGEIYRQMGVETSALYQDFIFTRGNNGIINISTRNPVNEPYLHFILLIRWPQGTIYREFNLLIDPVK